MLTIFTFQNNSFLNSGVKNGYFQNLILFFYTYPKLFIRTLDPLNRVKCIRWSIFVCLLTLFLSPRKFRPILQSYRGRDELMPQGPCGPRSLRPSLSGLFQKKSAPRPWSGHWIPGNFLTLFVCRFHFLTFLFFVLLKFLLCGWCAT